MTTTKVRVEWLSKRRDEMFKHDSVPAVVKTQILDCTSAAARTADACPQAGSSMKLTEARIVVVGAPVIMARGDLNVVAVDTSGTEAAGDQFVEGDEVSNNEHGPRLDVGTWFVQVNAGEYLSFVAATI